MLKINVGYWLQQNLIRKLQFKEFDGGSSLGDSDDVRISPRQEENYTSSSIFKQRG